MKDIFRHCKVVLWVAVAVVMTIPSTAQSRSKKLTYTGTATVTGEYYDIDKNGRDYLWRYKEFRPNYWAGISNFKTILKREDDRDFLDIYRTNASYLNDEIHAYFAPNAAMDLDFTYRNFRHNLTKDTGNSGMNPPGHWQVFNDDSTADSAVDPRYHTTRSDKKYILTLRPAQLGIGEGWLSSVTSGFEEQDNRGVRYASYILSGGQVVGGDDSHKWRGFDQRNDQHFTDGFAEVVLTPGSPDFMLAGGGGSEKFDEQASMYTYDDIPDSYIYDTGTVTLGTENVGLTGQQTIDFIPDFDRTHYFGKAHYVFGANDRFIISGGGQASTTKQTSYGLLYNSASKPNKVDETDYNVSLSAEATRDITLSGFYTSHSRKNKIPRGNNSARANNVVNAGFGGVLPLTKKIDAFTWGGDLLYTGIPNSFLRLSGRRVEDHHTIESEFMGTTVAPGQAGQDDLFPFWTQAYGVQSDKSQKYIGEISFKSRPTNEVDFHTMYRYTSADANKTLFVVDSERSDEFRIAGDYNPSTISAGVHGEYYYLSERNDNIGYDTNIPGPLRQNWKAKRNKWTVSGWWAPIENANVNAIYSHTDVKEHAPFYWHTPGPRFDAGPIVFHTLDADMPYKSHNDYFNVGASFNATPTITLAGNYLYSGSKSYFTTVVSDTAPLASKVDNHLTQWSAGATWHRTPSTSVNIKAIIDDYTDKMESVKSGQNVTIQTGFTKSF